jgi:O-antigen ligase
VGLAQFVGIIHLTTIPYDPVPLNRIRGTFSHPNVFASYLAMFLVFGIAMLPRVEARWRLYIAPACALAGALLLLTYSRAAWLAALVGLLAVAILQSHRLFWALIVVLFVVVVMVPSVTTRVSDLSGSTRKTGASSTQVDKNSVSWRFDYWKRILPDARQNPLTGLGLDMVRLTQPEHYAPHNVYIQSIVELGVVGFLAFLALIAAIASDLRRAWRRARGRFEVGMVLGVTLVALGLLMQTFSENLLQEFENQWYFFLPAAWVIAVVGSRSEESTDIDTLPPSVSSGLIGADKPAN